MLNLLASGVLVEDKHAQLRFDLDLRRRFYFPLLRHFRDLAGLVVLTGRQTSDNGGVITRGREAFARWLGLGVAAVGSTLILVFFLFVDLGGTVTGVIHPVSFAMSAAWAVPFWIYALLVRSWEGALVGGAGLLATTTAFLISMFSNTSSTSGIGIITIPIAFLYPLAGAALAVDWLFCRYREDRS
jgi:hypothetical protein